MFGIHQTSIFNWWFGVPGNYIVPWNSEQPVFNGCSVKQAFFDAMIWSHPTETTNKKWLFGVPGGN